MKKGIAIALALLFCLAIILALLFGRTSRGKMPVYQGKTAERWLSEIDFSNSWPVYQAFQAMGTNALPVVVRNLEKSDSTWDRFYWRNYPKLPALLRRHLSRPLDEATRWTLVVSVAGSMNALPALPDFARLLKDGDPAARPIILPMVIRLLNPSSTNCVPALIACLQDNNASVRMFAAMGLKQIGPGARAAVPALVKLADSSDEGLGKIARHSLETIDPEKAAKYKNK